MAFRDPGWTAFLSELRAHLKGRMTSAALADKLGVDEETVSNWRKGRTRPRLGQLPRIAEILHMGGNPSADGADPLYLYRQMGMLPPRPRDEELIDVAYRLQRLEQQLADATDRAGSLGRREGASTVVRAAMKTGDWAVAVWPVVEGTPDCPLRVADRIDIRRTDGKPVRRMTYGRTRRSRQPCGPPTRCRQVVALAGQPSRGSRTGPSRMWGLREVRWYSSIIQG